MAVTWTQHEPMLAEADGTAIAVARGVSHIENSHGILLLLGVLAVDGSTSYFRSCAAMADFLAPLAAASCPQSPAQNRAENGETVPVISDFPSEPRPLPSPRSNC